MSSENEKCNHTEQTGAVTTEKLHKAAEVQLKGSDDVLEKVEADAALESAARDAKAAEKFDHGKNDAGVKR